MIRALSEKYSFDQARADLAAALATMEPFLLRFPNNNVMTFAGLKNKNVKYQMFESVPKDADEVFLSLLKPQKKGTYETFAKDNDINAREVHKHIFPLSGWDPQTVIISSSLLLDEKEDTIGHTNTQHKGIS